MSTISSITPPMVTHLGVSQPSNIPSPNQEVDIEPAHHLREARPSEDHMERPAETPNMQKTDVGSPTAVLPIGETYPSNTAPHSATNRQEPASRLSAESKIAVIAQTFSAVEDAQPNPIRLASERAQELAAAREVVEKYRQSKAREEVREASNLVDEDENSDVAPNRRITPIDEIPDRPIPQAGVQVL